MPTAISDQQLVNRLKTGDQSALAEIYGRYKIGIYRFCFRMLSDRDTASEVVQRVFLRLFEQCRQIRNPASLRSWLFSVARNECLLFIREDNKFETLTETDDQHLDTLSTENDDAATSERRLELVNRAISQLRREFREVIILREYQNLSYKEISEVVGVPESTIKFRLFAARRQLYQTLKPILKKA